jgi:predicted regulator of Ras-like GTPase activity (Roadblock/LC7/MglB family)
LVGVEQDVLAELGRLRHKLPQVQGALVASADGLLVAEDAGGVEAETMAAMSAAYLGLAQQIALGAAYGEFQETVTRAAGGYVATFAAGTHALLTVLADAGINLGLLHHEARPVAARVGELVSASQG